MSFARFAPLLLFVLPAAASAQSMNAEIFYKKQPRWLPRVRSRCFQAI